MSSQDLTQNLTQNLAEKRCSSCHIVKEIIYFCRPSTNNSQREYATCNKCSERLKNKQQEKKIDTSTNQKISQSSSNITDTSSVNSDLQIIESINFADNFLEVTP